MERKSPYVLVGAAMIAVHRGRRRLRHLEAARGRPDGLRLLRHPVLGRRAGPDRRFAGVLSRPARRPRHTASSSPRASTPSARPGASGSPRRSRSPSPSTGTSTFASAPTPSSRSRSSPARRSSRSSAGSTSTRSSPRRRLGQTPYPEIREGASFLQATSTSAQELLTKAGVTVDRLNELLSPDNVGAVSDTLRNLSTTTTGLAKQDAAIQATLAELPGAVAEFRKTFDKLNGVAESLNLIALEVGPQDEATRKALAGKDPGELRKALAEARKAFANIDGAANQLGKLVTDNKAPIRALHRDRPHRAVAHHPRAAPAHRQPERHRHPARARPGRLRVQRQAGIYAQMIAPHGRLRGGRRFCSPVASCINAVTEDRPISIRSRPRARSIPTCLRSTGSSRSKRRPPPPISTPAASPSP